jgi:protein SCO1/2
MRPLSLAFATIVAAGAGFATWWVIAPDEDERLAACRGESGGVVGADIGGDFTLTAHDGRVMTAEALIDRPTLLYFGYTFCPDFCPTDAAYMAEAKALLAQRNIAINTAFVSVDPARDTPDVLRRFVTNLDPDMIGLTGTAEQIAEAARNWRVYYSIAGDRDDPYYLVDHSTFTYLMAPEIGFLDFFRHATDPAQIAERVACYADALS